MRGHAKLTRNFGAPLLRGRVHPSWLGAKPDFEKGERQRQAFVLRGKHEVIKLRRRF
jgi:hypothetical protein